MIILIGAESLTGKTLMAQTLLERYKIPYLSADLLKMGLYRAHANCGFTPGDNNALIEKHLWPIVKGIIYTAIENDQNLIIEGCYISPGRIKEFPKESAKNIIPIFMGFSENYLRNNFTSSVLHYRCAIEKRIYPEMRTMSWFIESNNKYKNACIESDIMYFEINNNYIEDVNAIYQWIAFEVERIKNINIISRLSQGKELSLLDLGGSDLKDPGATRKG